MIEKHRPLASLKWLISMERKTGNGKKNCGYDGDASFALTSLTHKYMRRLLLKNG